MRQQLIGIWIMAGAAFYCFTETKYFGSNWLPSSAEECICDGITLIVLSIGLATWAAGSGRRSPNDLKLSDRRARRGSSAGDRRRGAGRAKVAGWLVAAAVTCAPVRCSAWLGDVGSPVAFEYVDLAAYNIARVAGCVSNVIASNTAESRGSIFERRRVLEVVSEFGNVAVEAVNSGLVGSANGVDVLRVDALHLGTPLTEKVEEGALAGVSVSGAGKEVVRPPTGAGNDNRPDSSVDEDLRRIQLVVLFGFLTVFGFFLGVFLNSRFGKSKRESPNDPKLSDSPGWRDRCAVGERRRLEAAGVTAGRVRCSAWLGDVG